MLEQTKSMSIESHYLQNFKLKIKRVLKLIR